MSDGWRAHVGRDDMVRTAQVSFSNRLGYHVVLTLAGQAHPVLVAAADRDDARRMCNEIHAHNARSK